MKLAENRLNNMVDITVQIENFETKEKIQLGIGLIYRLKVLGEWIEGELTDVTTSEIYIDEEAISYEDIEEIEYEN